MLRQIMTAPGVIEFSQVPIPALEPGEVLVKIMKIGICGSDIHVYHGKHPFTQYPITQGHEVSGKIVQVTPQVTELTLGQKVTIEPQVVCGDCYPCRHGKYNLCENLKVMGFQTMGTGSEYFAVSAAKVTPLPYSMTYSEGAMIEPLAVTVHAAKKFPQLTGVQGSHHRLWPYWYLTGPDLSGLGSCPSPDYRPIGHSIEFGKSLWHYVYRQYKSYPLFTGIDAVFWS